MPEELAGRVRAVKKEKALRAALNQAAVCPSLEAFREHLLASATYQKTTPRRRRNSPSAPG